MKHKKNLYELSSQNRFNLNSRLLEGSSLFRQLLFYSDRSFYTMTSRKIRRSLRSLVVTLPYPLKKNLADELKLLNISQSFSIQIVSEKNHEHRLKIITELN